MNFFLCGSTTRMNATANLLRETTSNTSSNLNEASLYYLLEEWALNPQDTNMKMFLIPPVVCLVAGVLIIPSILFVIFSRFSIRKETRYMLLGNALLCDLIYLLFYTLSATLSAAHFCSLFCMDFDTERSQHLSNPLSEGSIFTWCHLLHHHPEATQRTATTEELSLTC